MKAEEFDAFMRETIEEPAAQRLAALLQRGLIRPSDVQRFKVSSVEFRRAILGNYESLDPIVRDELRASLIREYQRTVGDLVEDIVQRDDLVHADISHEKEERPDDPIDDNPESRRAPRQVIDTVLSRAAEWWQQRAQ
ncbi:hypothetical protein [Actinoplanes philippinensis]|uniref:hypothetical protein n=1 Tax=Actinoplanes philippinensis TaxID=35752 RepID=UPI00340B9C60